MLDRTSITVDLEEDVARWKCMVGLRTGAATPEELRAQNALPDPIAQELSLENEVAATESFLVAAKAISQWKMEARSHIHEESESLPENSRMAQLLQAEEDDILQQTISFAEAYRSTLRKREKKKQQRQKQKVKKQKVKDEGLLLSAVEELD